MVLKYWRNHKLADAENQTHETLIDNTTVVLKTRGNKLITFKYKINIYIGAWI